MFTGTSTSVSGYSGATAALGEYFDGLEEEGLRHRRQFAHSQGDEEASTAATIDMVQEEVLRLLSEAQPTSPCLQASKKRRPALIELPRKVRFENYESGGEDDERNPLKVSAIVCGVPILTEREADYMLSQKVEGWKKALFLLSNLPYVLLAFGSFFIMKFEHRSFHPSFDPLCESTLAHCALVCLVSITSITLHSSQVRVGHWCCNPARARTFHRRRVQDRFDLADTCCASLAVVLGVLCHGITEMGMQMVCVVPIFALSIVAKKLKWWNTYLLLHGLWHLSTAFLLWQIFAPALPA